MQIADHMDKFHARGRLRSQQMDKFQKLKTYLTSPSISADFFEDLTHETEHRPRFFLQPLDSRK